MARRLLQKDPDELLNSTRFARFQHNIWQPVQQKSFSGVWVCNGPPSQSLEPCSSDLTILFFHGGGYVLGSPAASAPTLLRISELAAESQPKLNISAFALQYSLAPEHRFPTQLNEAVAAYHYLVHDVGIQPRKLVVLGTSAGGHLALCFVRKLQELGLPQIGGLFLLSPWVSLTHSSKSFQLNEHKDTVTRRFLEKARNRFIGVERTNKEPGGVLDFSKDRIGGVKWGDVLPQKTFVSVGGDEVLLDDILEFVSAARRDGSCIHLDISEQKQHSWEFNDDTAVAQRYYQTSLEQSLEPPLLGASRILNDIRTVMFE